MNLTPWKSLEPGDTVDLVAPASAGRLSDVKKSIQVLKLMGLNPRLPKKIFSGHPIFSHSDQRRLNDLKKAIEAKDSQGIWCVRGGYGSIRLLAELNKIKKPRSSKVFIGFSDVTTLHQFFFQKWRWPTLHGPLFDRLGSSAMGKGDLKHIQDIVLGKKREVTFRNLKPMNSSAKKLKSKKASVIGGNFCVLMSSFGTPFELDIHNKFLFLEDIGERPHRVDRFLVQLSQSGKLKGCSGILLGDFILKNKTDSRHLWGDVFKRFSKETSTPVFRGLPVGHGKIQKTLPLGTKAQLQKQSADNFQLLVESGCL